MAKDSGTYRRGIIPMAVLLLLNYREMYGYELVQEMSRVTGERVKTQEGSLYPVLYKLQEAGYVSDEKKQVGKRMTRVYYSITPSGKEYLKQLVDEYKSVNDGVFMLMEFGGIGDE